MLNVPEVQIIQTQELHCLVQDMDTVILVLIPIMQVSSSQLGLELSTFRQPLDPEGWSHVLCPVEGSHKSGGAYCLILCPMNFCHNDDIYPLYITVLHHTSTSPSSLITSFIPSGIGTATALANTNLNNIPGTTTPGPPLAMSKKPNLWN